MLEKKLCDGDMDKLIILSIRKIINGYQKVEFATWANRWISGEDRSASSAHDPVNWLQEAR